MKTLITSFEIGERLALLLATALLSHMKLEKSLFKILIDELHVFLGVGNHIFDSMYEKMINDMKNDIFHGSVYHWAEKKNICGAKYNGGQLGAEFVILFFYGSRPLAVNLSIESHQMKIFFLLKIKKLLSKMGSDRMIY